MHPTPSEASVLRDLLNKEIAEHKRTKEKLKNLVDELEAVECDVSADRTWTQQYSCAVHDTFFRENNPTYVCPMGKFAQELKSKIYE